MGHVSRKEYLAAIRERYRTAGRKAKSVILGEFCEVCGYNRKYAVRLLNGKAGKGKRRPGPKPIYDAAVLLPLKLIWLAAEQPCSKRLVKVIELWLPFYEAEYEKLTPEVESKLKKLSPATIDRLLRPVKAKFKGKGLCGTKPGSLLKNIIPIKNAEFIPDKPGFIEADTVAHCGNSLEGDFVWSITFTDVFSGWTENRAIWNKGSAGVIEQVKDVEAKLSFPLLGFSSDNGSEFLTHHLWRYFTDRKDKVDFTRTRPYHKNDNARVEQKNWTHVRQLLGYDRFPKSELIPLINDLYTFWSLYQNHFLPTFKLIEKVKVNSKYKKKYEKAETPYNRLMASDVPTSQSKEALGCLHSSLNPFELKKTLEKKLRRIFNVLRLPEL